MRAPLPARRRALRQSVELDGIAVEVTVGLAPDGAGRLAPREVFLAGAKEGSAVRLLMEDAAVVLSLALQHGIAPADLAKSLGWAGAPGALGGSGARASVIGRVVDLLCAVAAEARDDATEADAGPEEVS